MDLTRTELDGCAVFDDDGFILDRLPSCSERGDLVGIELGRYELPRRSGDAHLYRINHPLALWLIGQAKTRLLNGSRLVFDYDAYGSQVSTLKAYRGMAGWLTLILISVDALGQKEQHLRVRREYDRWRRTRRRRPGKTAAVTRNYAKNRSVQRRRHHPTG